MLEKMISETVLGIADVSPLVTVQHIQETDIEECVWGK